MNKVEVLIIEDQSVGEIYRKHIERSLNIKATWVKNKAGALKVIEEFNIKVIIADQRLEAGELGTDVLRSIKEINPHIVTIMLSGEANTDELDTANQDGLFKYLNKSQVEKLSTYVLQALQKYEADIIEKSTTSINKLIFTSSKSTFSFWNRYKVYLVSQICIDKEFVFKETWKETYNIRAGQEREETEEIEVSTELIIENEIIAEIAQKYSLKVTQLKNSLATESNLKFSNKIRTQSSELSKVITRMTTKTSLPPIPQNTDEDYLVSKRYETNQVYEKTINFISIVCPCCSKNDIYTLVTYLPTNKIASREVNYYRSREKEIIDCGTSIINN